MRAVIVVLSLAIFTAVLPFASFAGPDDTVKITDIVIKGNSKVEADTIKSKMSTKVGGTFSPSGVRNDINAIYKMGYFDDVQVEAEGYAGGLRLTYTVVERPIIRSFTFEGNENIEVSKLREKVNLTPYSVYNPSLVSDNVNALELYYQGEGYFTAKVLPVIVRLSDKEVKVIFRIEEGAKVRIDDIEIVGNENISSRKIRKVMTTKEYYPIWSWIMSTGTYKLYDFAMDMERIKGLYFNNGYIQASVGEPEVVLDEENNELDITISINEGPQFTISGVNTEGNEVLDEAALLENVESAPGEVMNRDLLKDDVVRLTDRYGTMGYAFANITPILKPDVENRTVDITLQVDEGEKIFVNRIGVTGNSKTRDNVIRRELPFVEGEKYDTSGLRKSKERLKNLDYFEDVDVVTERVPDSNEVNLDVKVKEKSTGSISVGGGYSTVDRLMAIGEIKQRNLFGRGQELSFRAQWGSRRHNFSLSFTEPWLMGKPVALGLEAYNEERNQAIGFTMKSVGGSVSLGRRFLDYWSLTGSYSYTDYKYDDVSDELILANPEGSFDDQTISKIGLGLSRDSRDNYMMPHGGSRNSLYAEWSGDAIGSDRSYYKAIADSVWYFPLFWDTVFSLHGRAGVVYEYGGSEVPPSDLFYVGGINTIRGYDWGSVGPKVKVSVTDPNTGITTVEDQVSGGYKELIFNAEYTFPLVSQIQLYGVVFFDAGDAYGHGGNVDFSSFRYSAGGGFRWMSPMGLIRLEYGKVLDNIDPEQTGKWEFSIGTMF